ncbi:hypothetical protein CAPTEDRAFT_136789 [Capitella teleta]|uniref:RING-type domain-containing protein n=1 Tax=Capitella teleta TaxID=283909 RepID=R7U9N7_CAPTE|nr:hypothetical protein CAPTEDRAFT_136789 [Capitella teleta]|eukprot:ELU00518.1 hypothetical protein CAPTEDRAFT_136789 [Capitella teleta]
MFQDLIRLQEELGDVASRGMSDAQLEMLPTKVLNLNPGDPVTECPICCEDYAKKDLIKILTCFHEFHDHCIRAWLKVILFS